MGKRSTQKSDQDIYDWAAKVDGVILQHRHGSDDALGGGAGSSSS